MKSDTRLDLPSHLATVEMLSGLLERLERSREPVGPQQYRSVVDRLSAELRERQGDPALDALLRHFPAASELYENLQYEHAGLCRSPLEAALSAELATRALLGKAAGR